jgi:hypothetical protein
MFMSLEPTLEPEAESWLYWAQAIGLFLYQTADSLDG